MDKGARQATVHRVAKSWTQLEHLSTHAHKFHLDRGAGRATVSGVARVRHDLATKPSQISYVEIPNPQIEPNFGQSL